MLDDLLLYQEGYAIRIGAPTDPLFYFFDYDDRRYELNMEFQHFHAFYEVFVLMDDQAQHIIEGRPYALAMYDIVCLPPGLLHKTQYPVGTPKKRLVINFAFPEAFGLYQPEYRKLLSIFDEQVPIYRLSPNGREAAFAALNRVFNGSKTPGPLENLKIHQGFVDFMGVLYAERAQNRYKVASPQGTLSDKIYDICAYIHAHYREPLSLDALAKQFYISAFYLSHKFKEVTEFNLTDYIQRTRIRNAQQALMFTGKQITAISEACGFKSFAQFNRVFHKHCGMSPSQYRKENRPLWEKPLS